ncbi:unnamed protein product [Lactuca saligna]|uniref:ABC-2 type transporter transmembrane domain-containing protein n=1 Tax=Lactuca saligna TaxID=75948 RepID=A0AA36A4K1_LACSI|nr:unnamed protein product [Lactuca saligna]
MYSAVPYAIAQGLVEIPYIAAQTILYGITTYFMIKFQRTIGKFFLYIAFMFLTFTYFTFYGMLAIGLAPSQKMADLIPGWWIWFYYLCPITWTLQGLIGSQLADVEEPIIGPGGFQSAASLFPLQHRSSSYFLFPLKQNHLPQQSIVYKFVKSWELPRLLDRFKSAEGFLFVQDDMILNYWNLVQADKNKLWITDKNHLPQPAASLSSLDHRIHHR